MDERVAYCPNCKTYETLWFQGDRLSQTQKFSQWDGKVYHDCGSNEPCRLLVVYIEKSFKRKVLSRSGGGEGQAR